MRGPGAVMGVASDGSFAGSLSGGCIENAVVAEARETLKAASPRVVRFGTGSPYLDIKLPCGGGLDIHFQPLSDPHTIAPVMEAIAARVPFATRFEDGAMTVARDWAATRFDASAGSGAFGYWPAPRLQIIGHGFGVTALARLAREMSCEVAVLTPDDRILDELTDRAIACERLDRIDDTGALHSDPWTAITFLFHDHDWEIDLMERALQLPHFYLGAMGGRRAHAFRCAALGERGVSDAKLNSIRAPIGLFHSSRDPQTLALSTLAEVIRAYEATDFAGAHG